MAAWDQFNRLFWQAAEMAGGIGVLIFMGALIMSTFNRSSKK